MSNRFFFFTILVKLVILYCRRSRRPPNRQRDNDPCTDLRTEIQRVQYTLPIVVTFVVVIRFLESF